VKYNTCDEHIGSFIGPPNHFAKILNNFKLMH